MSKAAVSVSALPGLSAADRTSRRQRIFLPAALAATALAIIGFWRTYFGPLLAGAVHEPVVIHVHAVVMVTWLVLVMMQVWFAASGQVRLHIRLGPWVIWRWLTTSARSAWSIRSM